MRVKICGLQDEATALAAVAAGADFLGFVFAPSRRRVTPERARAIVAAVRERYSPDTVKMVGVFVDECPLLIDDVAAFCGLDYAQLCGHAGDAYLQRLATPAIVALPATADLSPDDLATYPQAVLFLLDAYSPSARGGTGRVCDWQAAGRAARLYPLLLAGGLNPDNVAAAIAAVRPWGVDVSSGVETDGRKDPAKMADFVRRAKEAARSRATPLPLGPPVAGSAGACPPPEPPTVPVHSPDPEGSQSSPAHGFVAGTSAHVAEETSAKAPTTNPKLTSATQSASAILSLPWPEATSQCY